MTDWLRSVDASAAASWFMSHSASAVGKAGAAFVGAIVAIAVVGTLVFAVNTVALVAVARRSVWPQGHLKWAWLLVIAVGFVASVSIPGFYVWLGLAAPVAYWCVVGRIGSPPE